MWHYSRFFIFHGSLIALPEVPQHTHTHTPSLPFSQLKSSGLVCSISTSAALSCSKPLIPVGWILFTAVSSFTSHSHKLVGGGERALSVSSELYSEAVQWSSAASTTVWRTFSSICSQDGERRATQWAISGVWLEKIRHPLNNVWIKIMNWFFFLFL